MCMNNDVVPLSIMLYICGVHVVQVGLAVGDTAEEKDKATFTRTRLQVEFILELEAMSSFLRGRMRPTDNKRHYGNKVCNGIGTTCNPSQYILKQRGYT